MNNEFKTICPKCGSEAYEIKGTQPYWDNPIIRDGVIINKKSQGTEYYLVCLKCHHHFTRKQPRIAEVPVKEFKEPLPKEENKAPITEQKIEQKVEEEKEVAAPVKPKTTQKTTSNKTATRKTTTTKKQSVKKEEK